MNAGDVYRGFQFRMYPTREQQRQLGKIFSAVRFTHNRLLQAWIREPDRELSCLLEELIREAPWLVFIDHSILEHAVRELEKSCLQYSRRYGLPSPGAPGLPGFWSFRNSGASFTVVSPQTRLRYNTLVLGGQRGIRPVRVVPSRRLPADAGICSATVSRNPAGQYHVFLLCRVRPQEPSGVRCRGAVGLKYSTEEFFQASDVSLKGRFGPCDLTKELRQLSEASRRLACKQPRSRNYEKQRRRVSAIRLKILCRKRDYLHKLSSWIADRYVIVCIEASSSEEERHGIGSAGGMNRDDWEELARMLDYKTREKGGHLIRIGDGFPSMRRCHACGCISGGTECMGRRWACSVCGTVHDRDTNACLNILKEGLARLGLKRGIHPVMIPAGETGSGSLGRAVNPYPAAWENPPDREYGMVCDYDRDYVLIGHARSPVCVTADWGEENWMIRPAADHPSPNCC